MKCLQKKNREAVELQSKLDMTQDEIYQMQDLIGDQQQKAAGAAKREASLENELLQSIHVENEYYNLKAKWATSQAQVADLGGEADKIPVLNKEIDRLTGRIAALESKLEIATMENTVLQEELVSYKTKRD